MTTAPTAPPAPSRARSARTRSWRPQTPVASAVRLVLFLMYGIPIIWILTTSLKRPGDVLSRDAAFFFTPTLDAYTAVLANGNLLGAGLQSLTIALSTTVLTLVLAIPAAYFLARAEGLWSTLLLAGLIVLQIMPQTSMVIPLFQVFGEWRILDQTIAVILADTALLTPFAILLLRPFFRSVPDTLEEAASIDGASTWRTFRSVLVPLVSNGIATTGTLVFLISWGEFLYAVNFFLSPNNYPLSALLAQQVSAYGINWPGLMALAVITSIPILVLFTFTYRFLKEGLTLGAVK